MSKKYAIHDMAKGALTASFSVAMMGVSPLMGYTPADAKFATESAMDFMDAALSKQVYKAPTPKAPGL